MAAFQIKLSSSPSLVKGRKDVKHMTEHLVKNDFTFQKALQNLGKNPPLAPASPSLCPNPPLCPGLAVTTGLTLIGRSHSDQLFRVMHGHAAGWVSEGHRRVLRKDMGASWELLQRTSFLLGYIPQPRLSKPLKPSCIQKVRVSTDRMWCLGEGCEACFGITRIQKY